MTQDEYSAYLQAAYASARRERPESNMKNKMTFDQLEAEVTRLTAELEKANEAKAKATSVAQTQTQTQPEADKRTPLEIFASIKDPIERGRYYSQNESAIRACFGIGR